jgi:hypothetical protein
MKKFHQVELKSPLIPPAYRRQAFSKGEDLITLPFIKGGGEGLLLFQRAKFILIVYDQGM